jgi:hypothetical protein
VTRHLDRGPGAVFRDAHTAKPTHTGGVPASQERHQLGREWALVRGIHAAVCTTARSAGSCHGPRIGFAASHG